MSRELYQLFSDTSEQIGVSPKIPVRDGSIELRLVDCREGGVLLQRIHTRRDGSVVVLLLDGTERTQMTEFLENDPYNEVLAPQYHAIVDAVGRRPHRKVNTRAIASVADCHTELDVLTLMRTVCATRGGTYALFHWLSTSTASPVSGVIYDTHVILAACPPSWLQVYERRVVTDPVLEYARNHVMPVRGFEAFGNSNGPWFAREAGLYGLRSNVFLPANRGSDGGKVFGLLHVSSGTASPGGDDVMWQGQRELRGLAEELLDWPAIRFRRAAALQYRLSDAERTVLQWIRRGGDATHAAADLVLTQRQIYRLYKSIKIKMGRDDIRACARMAADAGLIDQVD
ncbi:MAG: hypothetical protein IOC33_11130 [Burkholderia sp.]|jgi:hypothetical protein|uniref:helix-turn-helix transcriptional regulator n=1 Tax=Burkholderia TaxID=32008 RepID=UPI001CF29E72|nr:MULTISPECIES: hypothetical protein [Burkholderia]MCA3785184.1 hypothetical protein [Burkholderia sp.]MCA3793093.1 hypothetical protein [Burkholderia sp.]MCA3799640.1 hypothetical protein [Burkholderia sp.]MCA3808841.1 hypothetical protein [Burkholderia sp.]MCA3828769.1 hypothetical protein [Burkholderia sp.]